MKFLIFPTVCPPGALVHIPLTGGALPGVGALAEVGGVGVDTGAAIATRTQFLTVISAQASLQRVQPPLEAPDDPPLSLPPPLQVVITLHGLLHSPHSLL